MLIYKVIYSLLQISEDPVSPPCPLLLSKAGFGKLFTNFFSFMYFEFLLAALYHFLDLNNACLLVLRIAELLIIE